MYYYLVEYWDTENEKTVRETGMCAGTDYGAAANRIVKYYGSENVFSLKITELEDVLYEEDILDMFNHEVED